MKYEGKLEIKTYQWGYEIWVYDSRRLREHFSHSGSMAGTSSLKEVIEKGLYILDFWENSDKKYTDWGR